MTIRISRRFLPTLVAASVLGLPAAVFAPAALAQNQAAPASAQPSHVRGVVVSASATSLKVKTREGATVDLALADNAMVAGVTRATVADIKPGDFVGIASLPKADGGDGALEVLIFPPAMKGTGEGSYGWDLKPNSSMTNATVANAVKGVDGHNVTVAWQGKEKKIAIPNGTPVVTIAPATKADLVAGAHVFIIAAKDAKGALAAQRVMVGTHGVVPPM